ncbi:MAG: hypothetical protein A2Y78_00015 [Acidobacteria bacterium RBG_13_68_16]|nr:MAG: hypothetical protein A2Y78_00015 [Acidobacteria bacterium RBG_13_68_16]
MAGVDSALNRPILPTMTKPTLYAALAVALRTNPTPEAIQALVCSYGFPCPTLQVRTFGAHRRVLVERATGDALDAVLARLGALK